ncbi:ISWI family [Phytophthora cactorum]|nr:ISWI family [Phytophthora cactorum]
MAFLMAQSDVFTSFLMGGSSALGKEMSRTKAAKEAGSKRGKGSKQADAQTLQDMDDARYTRITQQPSIIKFGTMKPYQLEGLNWMIRLHDSGVNGILADEMGLGKTLQSISLLAYLREARGIEGPHIIIVPKSTWKYLLIDEAHRVKNENSKLSRVVREFKVEHRLLITGTPLQNNLHELWALLNFLLPDVFSDSEDFDAWFNVDEQEGQENVIKKLHTILRPFLLRRLKADVEHSLPPKIETKLYLRKVCNHPYLFEGAEPGPPYQEGPHLWENCGKMTLLHKLLPKLQAQGSRVLIFCQMTSMMDILEDYMRFFGHDYCRLDGSTKGEDRDNMMEEFNAPGSSKFCFLLSTRAGGLGINLATADIVILFDSDWNPQVDLQAMDRAHRIGQTKIVRVFRFITDGTVEEKIVERAERKLYLDAAIIQQGRLAQQNRKLSKDELMTMRTEAMKGKIAADMQHNLANFSLSGDNGNASVSSLYEFEGEVFSKDTNNGDILPSTFIALPQRERKSNYNEDEYYRQQAGLSKPKKPKKSGSDAAKVPVVHDYQFFQQERMVALLTKKTQVENRRKELTRLIKEAKADEARVKARKAKGEDSAENSAEEGGEDDDARSAALEKELNETEMDAADAKELEELEKEGFGDWTRRDLKQFINSCERYGRADRTRVCEEVSLVLGKDPAQVERYYDTFWSRHTELKDHAKYIEKIERGEKRLERNEVVKQALARKCSRYSHPLRDMRLHYPAGYKSKGYILEEDVFLVVMMNKYGPLEHWGEIRDEIRKAWQFRFDWFFKSRTIGELQKRGELLTRMIERENDELKSKSSKVEDDLAKKAKKSSSSSSSKSKSKSSSSRSKTSSSSSSKKRSSSSKSSSSSSKKQRSSQVLMLSRRASRDISSMIQPLLEEEDEEDDEMDPLEQLEPVDTMMTVTVVEPAIRPRQHLIRRSSSAVERVPMPATSEELEDGGDKSLRPRFLQERSATIVHITPQVAEPARVPRSKASAFLLDVLAKSRGSAVVADNRRSPLESLHPPGVTNTVHYVPQHGGERGVPLRKAARKTRRIGRKLSIDTSSDLLASDKPERTRGRRVSASQEHMAAIVRALQDSKQQMQEQFQILHSILRFTNSSARDEDGKRPVLKEMVDVGIIPELASTMREFRFHTGLQICVMTILSALAEESPLNAYMMSEDRVVMLASNLVRAIEDSKHTVNIPAYQAEKAAKAIRQSATYTNTVVAAITRQTLSSPSPTSKSSRVLISSAPSPEIKGLGIEKTNLAQSAGRQRQAFSPDMVRPALSANYRLLVSQKLKKAEAVKRETSMIKDSPIMNGTEENGNSDEKDQEKEDNEEKEDDESYEDDFDTTGDDVGEVKTMPSRRDSSQVASDGELIDMLTEINAATTIQRHVRGLLVRRELAPSSRSEPSKNASSGLVKKNSRMARGVKSGRRGSKPTGIKGKRVPLSARQLQNQGSSKGERLRNQNGLRSVTRTRPATTMPATLFTPMKSKQGSANDGVGVRQRVANTNNQFRSPCKPFQIGESSAFSSTCSSDEAEHEQKTEDAEVVKEPLDPESLKQIQTLYAEGLQHHKENHLGLALEYYEKALALPGGQSFASLHVNLGSALMAQNKFSEALDSFEQAKRIQPNNVKAIYNYSVALLHLDRPQEAQRLLRRILELDSTTRKPPSRFLT